MYALFIQIWQDERTRYYSIPPALEDVNIADAHSLEAPPHVFVGTVYETIDEKVMDKSKCVNYNRYYNGKPASETVLLLFPPRLPRRTY